MGDQKHKAKQQKIWQVVACITDTLDSGVVFFNLANTCNEISWCNSAGSVVLVADL